jgi:dihydrofolate reductase
MILSLIAAMANQQVIGFNNQMPWHMPADLAHFKKVTLGKPVIMGRKTYDSIGRLLPGRRNIIISRQAKPENVAADWVSSLDAALAIVADQAEVMIIGGAELYRQTVTMADRLYLTKIDLDTQGDAFFPEYQTITDWQLVDEEIHQANVQNPYNYRFLQYNRKC